MANIRDLCTRQVVVATREMTVAEAAALMRHHHVGTIVVCEHVNGGARIPIGIVTDRDIVVGVVAPGLDAKAITVGDIMGQQLITARETEGVLQVLEIMRYRGVRRLPIVREDSSLAGIVSIDDLLGVLAEQLTDIAKTVARERDYETRSRT